MPHEKELSASDMPSRFQVLVPCGYGFRPDISGPLGVQPSVAAFGEPVQCVRWRLPQSIDSLVYRFPKPPGPFANEIVRNFYHLDEYFIVDGPLKDFLAEELSSDIEVAAIDMRHQDGTPAKLPYFAVKVVRSIECVATDRSVASIGRGDTDFFARRVVNATLDNDAVAEFANVDGARYVAYPPFSMTRELYLNEERIPPGIALFQPAYWPGALIATPEIVKQLSERCDGGWGYNFWALDQGDVWTAYLDLMHMLR
jgi:hypothetical protein